MIGLTASTIRTDAAAGIAACGSAGAEKVWHTWESQVCPSSWIVFSSWTLLVYALLDPRGICCLVHFSTCSDVEVRLWRRLLHAIPDVTSHLTVLLPLRRGSFSRRQRLEARVRIGIRFGARAEVVRVRLASDDYGQTSSEVAGIEKGHGETLQQA